MNTGALSANHTTVVSADTNNIGAPSLGFMVNADDNLSYRARGDETLRTFPFKAGIVYPIDLVQVDLTGSGSITQVLILRRGAKFS